MPKPEEKLDMYDELGRWQRWVWRGAETGRGGSGRGLRLAGVGLKADRGGAEGLLRLARVGLEGY